MRCVRGLLYVLSMRGEGRMVVGVRGRVRGRARVRVRVGVGGEGTGGIGGAGRRRNKGRAGLEGKMRLIVGGVGTEEYAADT